MTVADRPRFVLYTAALPAYRRSFLEAIEERLGSAWCAYAGPSLLDTTVKTGVGSCQYVPVNNHHWLGGRLLFQWGHWREVIAAQTAILDLTPRSVSAWCLLLVRKTLRRRTLVWGHLDPRKGPGARTAVIRGAMRELADGCIVYSYEHARRLRDATRRREVWVAPNALYRQSLIRVASGRDRNLILYVGRLEPAKKPMLLVRAFALVASVQPNWELVIVGDGALRDLLESLAKELGVAARVSFRGTITEATDLEGVFSQAHCAVSPGGAGLALTQSLGFGVPIVVADDELHGPEIELASLGGVVFFRRDSAEDLAAKLRLSELVLSPVDRAALAKKVRARHSAEVMAQGFIDAVTATPSQIEADDR